MQRLQGSRHARALDGALKGAADAAPVGSAKHFLRAVAAHLSTLGAALKGAQENAVAIAAEIEALKGAAASAQAKSGAAASEFRRGGERARAKRMASCAVRSTQHCRSSRLLSRRSWPT